MMKFLMRMILGVALTAAAGSPARAGFNVIGQTGPVPNTSDYLFGFSDYDGNEKLTLGLAGGGTVVLDTNGNQGWWSATDSNIPGPNGNTNYIVGQLGTGASAFNINDFFIFNTASLVGNVVVSATLSVTQYQGLSDTGNTTETLRLGSVSTSAATLVGTSGTSAAIYNDLGAGSLYATSTLPALGIESFNTVGFVLNGTAVNDINTAIAGADGFNFKIGGSILGITSGAVPEPSSLVLTGIASLGLLGYGLRARWTKARIA
jgi:hypothetical protein